MRTPYAYLLAEDGETPVPVDDPIEWAHRRSEYPSERDYGRIGDWDCGNDDDASVRVSTVFLGLDHAFAGGPPILWETMIFGFPEDHKLDQYCTRYTSAQAARRGHHWYVWLLERQGCVGKERIV